MSLHLIIPGEAPVKKNNRKEAYTRKNKETGLYMPLRFPISYYTKAYNGWAWEAVQYMRSWKEQNKFKIINEPVVISMFFYRKTSPTQVIDLQNLYDSICDLLAGNSGLNLPKKLQMEHEDYKILEDDSFHFLKSHGASHIFYDKMRPRTEVFISRFKLEMLTKAYAIFHPDIIVDKVANVVEQQRQESIQEKLPFKEENINLTMDDI